MKKRLIISLFSFIIISDVFFVSLALAQSDEEDNQTTENNESFTGTLSEEDPDNADLQKEAELFGTEEAGEETPIEENLPTHLLSLNFEGHVVISDSETTVAYLEIFYFVKIEQEIEIKKTRSRTTSTAEITTNVIGSLAGNDLFSCGLDVGGLSSAEVESMTLHTIIPETEETPEQSNLAVQVKFSKKLEEDWFADCLSGDYSMKTQGDTEEFLHKIWEGIEPDPKLIAIENYDILGVSELDFFSPPLIIADEDTGDDFELTGQGELTIEPL